MLNLGNLGMYVERKEKSAWAEFPVENASRKELFGFSRGVEGG